MNNQIIVNVYFYQKSNVTKYFIGNWMDYKGNFLPGQADIMMFNQEKYIVEEVEKDWSANIFPIILDVRCNLSKL